MRCPFVFAALAAAGLLAAPAEAQLNNQWVTYVKDNARLGNIAPNAISNQNIETDMAWGDLNKDGFVDLVIVRKQPFTSAGKRTNLLLMNENGVLMDRTAQFATASDVQGDLGFNTPTNDRDVVITDVDQDGWDDFVTATTISDGDPKYIGHPRVYRNLGKNNQGAWLGMKYEDARFPQLIHFGTGLPQNPRFCSVAAGDVTGNGFPDLYFGDYDSSGAGGAQQGANEDLNDRLLINDGNGFFADESQLRMSSTMLKSAFGMAVVIDDINLDGAADVIKDTALNAPQYVAASYNDPNNVGFFNIFQQFHTFSPYHVNIGDLNNDGRMDVVVSDDGSDRYRFNTGNDSLGRVVWSNALTFAFAAGGDDGFGSNNLVRDLDNDGWADVLICDVDVDIAGCNRYMHIYHNLGGSPGSTNITLRHERQSTSGGWLGVVGPVYSDLNGTHDVAVFDLDNDGDKDMVISTCDQTDVWLNQLDPTCPQPVIYGPTDVGCFSGGPATTTALGSPFVGGAFIVRMANTNKNSFCVMLTGTAQKNVAKPWGTLLVGGQTFRTLSKTNALGEVEFYVPVEPALAGLTRYMQVLVRDPGCGTDVLQHSQGVQVTFCP